MAVLIIDASKQKIPLEHPTLTIGSGDKSMIQIQDPKLGPLHCQIIKNGGAFRLISLDQATGTFVNGVKIRDQQLKSGDVIQLGATKLVFQDSANGPSPTQALRPPTAAVRQGTQAMARPMTQNVQRPPSSAVPRPTTKSVPASQPLAARPPTQATRPPTAGIRQPTQAAVRPTTQVPRAPTQSMGRPGTQAVSRPATQSQPQRSVTQRTTQRGATRNTQRNSKRSAIMTAKIEMHKKHLPRGLVIGFVTLLIFGAVFGGIWISRDTSDAELEAFSKKTGKMSNDALQAEDDKNFEKALKLYDEIIAECQKLSEKAKEKAGDLLGTYKLRRMNCEKLKNQGSVEARKVADFIKDAEAQIAAFKLEDARPFLYKNDWIQKATQGEHEKAKTLFADLAKKVEEADAAIPMWSEKAEPKFNDLMKEREYVKAKKFIEDFVARCKKDPKYSDQIPKTTVPANRITGEAKSYLSKVRSNLVKEKPSKSKDDLKKMFDEEVAKCFEGILPKEDLEKAWEAISKE
jgi:cell division septum initiation protein DivIVA